MALTHQQIKAIELQLLEINGPCLSSCIQEDIGSPNFSEVASQTMNKQLQRIKSTRIKSTGNSPNSNIVAFLYVMLQSIYSGQTKEDLLDQVKSALYSKEMNLASITHSFLPYQSNDQLKKIVVQFFYSLTYSHLEDKVSAKLKKYPIIVDILVLFLRRILSNFNVANALEIKEKIQTQSIFSVLVQYFDLNCKEQGNLYLFYEDRLFIFQDLNGEVFVGSYAQNQTQKIEKASFRRQMEDLEEIEENSTQKRSEASHNRSLELRGIVSESLVIGQQLPTPFFKLDDSNISSSFKASHSNSQAGEGDYQLEALLKASKQITSLKKMDIMKANQQMGLGASLNMKRTIIIEDQKDNGAQKQEPKPFQSIIYSPITLDSPHTIDLPSDKQFSGKMETVQLNVPQQAKKLKKSQSERMKNPHQNSQSESLSPKNFSQTPNDFKGASSKVPLQQIKRKCFCLREKQRKIKLCSHLYQINMSYIHQPLNFSKRKQPILQVTLPTPIKKVPISTFLKSPRTNGPERNHKQYLVFKKFNKTFARNNPSQTRKNSFSRIAKHNPESDAFSRTQFSPASNNDKSLSKNGAKSITPPKAKPPCNHTLRYSIKIPAKLNKQSMK